VHGFDALPGTLAQSMVHTLDPVVVDFGGGFAVRWYGLAYLTGFVVAWALVHWLARRKLVPIAPAAVADFMTACVVGVVVGGRLGHVVFYDPHLLWTFHDSFPFWGVLELNRGGMSSHGGMIGTFVAMLWFSRQQRASLLACCDVVCFAAPAGLMFGRLANWVNGELWGRVLPDAMQASPPWWSVKYPEEVIKEAQRALKASGGNPVAEQALRHAEQLYVACYQGDAAAAQQVAQMVPARYPSQFLQAITDGPMLMAVVVLVWLRPRKPGTVLASFFVAYGVLRLGTEQVREPDEGVFMVGSATLPMLLSGAMVVVGIVALWWFQRLDGERVGGLLRAGSAK